MHSHGSCTCRSINSPFPRTKAITHHWRTTTDQIPAIHKTAPVVLVFPHHHSTLSPVRLAHSPTTPHPRPPQAAFKAGSIAKSLHFATHASAQAATKALATATQAQAATDEASANWTLTKHGIHESATKPSMGADITKSRSWDCRIRRDPTAAQVMEEVILV